MRALRLFSKYFAPKMKFAVALASFLLLFAAGEAFSQTAVDCSRFKNIPSFTGSFTLTGDIVTMVDPDTQYTKHNTASFTTKLEANYQEDGVWMWRGLVNGHLHVSEESLDVKTNKRLTIEGDAMTTDGTIGGIDHLLDVRLTFGGPQQQPCQYSIYAELAVPAQLTWPDGKTTSGFWPIVASTPNCPSDLGICRIDASAVTSLLAGSVKNVGEEPIPTVWHTTWSLTPNLAYVLTPPTEIFSQSGGRGSVVVTCGTGTPADANWTAASATSWITINSGANGTCNGTVAYTVLANTGSARTGTITIGGGTFTVTQAGAAGAATGLRFVPITPCRVADTRNPAGTFGGPSLQPQLARDFPLWSAGCGISSSAAAYSLNVTVVPKGPLSYLTIWPSGQAQPLVSTLNSADGRTKANAAIVPAGNSGGVSIFATNAADVILDVNGYFEPNVNTDLVFFPLTPCRIADTRNSNAPLGGPILAAGQVRNFPILNANCGVPNTAKAYALNMTVVPTTALSFLTTWPTGLTQPLVSTLNSPTGAVLANAAIVPAGSNGSINVYVTDQSHVIVDINGYFAPPASGGLLLYPVTPCRMVDTRNQPGGLFSAPSLQAVQARGFPLLSSACSLSPSARAYSMNVTVVPQGPLSYLTLWPAGQSMPGVSTLNAGDGSVTSNAAIVPNQNGAINAFVTNATDVLFDINGYFAP